MADPTGLAYIVKFIFMIFLSIYALPGIIGTIGGFFLTKFGKKRLKTKDNKYSPLGIFLTALGIILFAAGVGLLLFTLVMYFGIHLSMH